MDYVSVFGWGIVVKHQTDFSMEECVINIAIPLRRVGVGENCSGIASS
jgi:hypothetical protein